MTLSLGLYSLMIRKEFSYMGSYIYLTDALLDHCLLFTRKWQAFLYYYKPFIL